MLSSIYVGRESTFWHLSGAASMLQTNSFFKGHDRSGRAKQFVKQVLSNKQIQRAIAAATAANVEAAQKMGPEFDFSFTPGSYANLRYVVAHRLKNTINDRFKDTGLFFHKASQWFKMPAGARFSTYDGAEHRLKREDLARNLNNVPALLDEEDVTAEQVLEWMWLPAESNEHGKHPGGDMDDVKLVFRDPSLLFPSDDESHKDFLVLDDRYAILARAYFICSELLHAFAVPVAVMRGREKIETESRFLSRFNPENEEQNDEDDAEFQFNAARKTYLPLMRDLAGAMILFLGTKTDEDVGEKSIDAKRVAAMAHDLEAGSDEVVRFMKHVSEHYETPIYQPFATLESEIVALRNEALKIVGLTKSPVVSLTAEKHADMKRSLAKKEIARKNGGDEKQHAAPSEEKEKEETPKPHAFTLALAYCVFGTEHTAQLYPAIKYALNMNNKKKHDPAQIALVLKRVPNEEEKRRLREIVHELMLRTCVVNPEIWPWEIKGETFDEEDCVKMLEWIDKWVVDDEQVPAQKAQPVPEEKETKLGAPASVKIASVQEKEPTVKEKEAEEEEPEQEQTKQVEPTVKEKEAEEEPEQAQTKQVEPTVKEKEAEEEPEQEQTKQVEKEKEQVKEQSPPPDVSVAQKEPKKTKTPLKRKRGADDNAETHGEKTKEKRCDEKVTEEILHEKQEEKDEIPQKKARKAETHQDKTESKPKKRNVVVKRRKRTVSKTPAKPAVKKAPMPQKRKRSTVVSHNNTKSKKAKTLEKEDIGGNDQRMSNRTEFLKAKTAMLSDLTWIEDKRNRDYVSQASGVQRSDILFMYYVTQNYGITKEGLFVVLENAPPNTQRITDADLFVVWETVRTNTNRKIAAWPTEKSAFVIRAVLAAGRQYEDTETKPTRAQIEALEDAYKAAQYNYNGCDSAVEEAGASVDNSSDMAEDGKEVENADDDSANEDDTTASNASATMRASKESEDEPQDGTVTHVASTSSNILKAKAREHAAGKAGTLVDSGSTSSSESSSSSSSSSSEDIPFSVPPN